MTSRPMSDVPGLAAAMAALVCPRVSRGGGSGRRPTASAGSTPVDDGRVGAGLIVIWRVAGRLRGGLPIADAVAHGAVAGCWCWSIASGRGVAGAMLGAAIAFDAGALAWGIPLLVASGGLQRLSGRARQPGRRGLRRRRDAVPQPDAAARGVRAAANVRLAVGPACRWRRGTGAGGRRARSDAARCASAARLLAVAAIAAARISRSTWRSRTRRLPATRLPMVLPVAFLAAVALDAAGRVGVAGRVSGWRPGASASPSRNWRPTSRSGSPTARLFDRVTADVAAASHAPVVAMHQALLRPLEAEPRPVGTQAAVAAAPRVARACAALADRRAPGPVWFLADPAAHRPRARRSAGPPRRRDASGGM